LSAWSWKSVLKRGRAEGAAYFRSQPVRKLQLYKVTYSRQQPKINRAAAIKIAIPCHGFRKHPIFVSPNQRGGNGDWILVDGLKPVSLFRDNLRENQLTVVVEGSVNVLRLLKAGKQLF